MHTIKAFQKNKDLKFQGNDSFFSVCVFPFDNIMKKSPIFLSHLNEINGDCEKILPVSGSRMMDFTARL